MTTIDVNFADPSDNDVHLVAKRGCGLRQGPRSLLENFRVEA